MNKYFLAVLAIVMVSILGHASDVKPGDITYMDEDLVNNSQSCVYFVGYVLDPIRVICNGKNAIQFQPATSFSGFDKVHLETRAVVVAKTIELLTRKGFKVLGSDGKAMDLVNMQSITFLKR